MSSLFLAFAYIRWHAVSFSLAVGNARIFIIALHGLTGLLAARFDVRL